MCFLIWFVRQSKKRILELELQLLEARSFISPTCGVALSGSYIVVVHGLVWARVA